MTNLSISLPDNVAKASNEVAKKLGISRTEFIRQAVIHEINNFNALAETNAIIQSFNAMKKSKVYLIASENIVDNMNSTLPNEKDEWWKGKKA